MERKGCYCVFNGHSFREISARSPVDGSINSNNGNSVWRFGL